MLSYLATATPKKERAGGNPTTGRLGGQVIFQSSSRPEGPPSFKCTRLAGTLGGPTWIWRFGVSSTEAQALHVRQGAPLLIHPPQLVSASAQLWGPQSSSGSRDVTPAQVTKAWGEYSSYFFVYLSSFFLLLSLFCLTFILDWSIVVYVVFVLGG